MNIIIIIMNNILHRRQSHITQQKRREEKRREEKRREEKGREEKGREELELYKLTERSSITKKH